jgi:hypothetical protein
MPHSLQPLVCFNSGELSPTLDSRLDLPAYRKGCRLLRNMIPLKTGGATRRPGTQWIALGKQNITGLPSVSRLQKFQYAPGTTFMLEFCDKGIRFYSNGAQVQVTTAPDWVTGTSYPAGAFVRYPAVTGGIYYLYNGPLVNSTSSPNTDTTHWTGGASSLPYEVPSPYLATNFTPPNYWTSDVFTLACCQINDVVYIVHPSYPVYKLISYSNTNWVMQAVQFMTPALLDQNATDTTLTASALTGAITLTASAAAWVTATYYTPGNSVTSGGLIYNCVQVHVSGTFAADLAKGLWTLVTIFQEGHKGSYWQLAYNRPASFIEFDATPSVGNYTFAGGSWYNSVSTLFIIGTWEFITYGTWQGDVSVQASYDNGVTWQVITTVSSRADANFNVSGQDIVGGLYRLVVTNAVATASASVPRLSLTADNQFVYGLVQITELWAAWVSGNSYVVGNVVNYGAHSYTCLVNTSGTTIPPSDPVHWMLGSPYIQTAQVITPLYATSATIYWSEGAWSDVRGYPQAAAVFQERLWYGGTTAQPQRVWGTQTDDIENFALLDQSQATYGLAFDLNAPGRGPIQWLAAQTDLMIGLAGAEWIMNSGTGTNTAITPSAVLAMEHSANGSAPSLPGLIISNAAFYVTRKGTRFQQMLFSVFTNKYMSQDMQVLSQHLTAARVKQFDFQQEFQNHSLLWAVCGDGSLISMTYAMEQEVFGWAKHLTGQDRGDLFLSAQVIYGSEGNDDEVWVSVLRQPGSSFLCQIERLWPVDWQTANEGLPDLTQAFYADWGLRLVQGTDISPASATFGAGFAGLTGRQLVVSINGRVAASGLVGSTLPPYGVVTVPNYVPVAGDVIVVGLPINWYVQPMRLDLDARARPIPAVNKSIAKLYPRLLNSIGGNWATRQNDIIPLPTYQATAVPGQPPPFMPNVPQEVEVDCGSFMQNEVDPQFILQGSDPLPFTVLGITVKYDISGSA